MSLSLDAHSRMFKSADLRRSASSCRTDINSSFVSAPVRASSTRNHAVQLMTLAGIDVLRLLLIVQASEC